MPGNEDTLKHSTLQRTLRGKASPSTIQYRNLKYASISARFKDSVPNDALVARADGVVDATEFGPSCPHLRGAQAWDLTLTGNVVLVCEEGQGKSERMDEFECLHVNVTVPKTTATMRQNEGRGLPVFVWVHGGGLSIGSNSWPQYDLRRFVERSCKIGKPIIGVSMNYRHNIFGFLASKEVGAAGNMGFKDQVLAFRWIKKHIAGFGGDPHSITAAGESAGGISLSTLLCANVRKDGLFDRVVIMSGETTLRKSRNRWWHQKMYEDQSIYLKLDPNDVEGRKSALLDTDAEELVQKLPLGQHFAATVDGEWLKQDAASEVLRDGYEALHKPSWCKEFVIGDTAHDGLVLKTRVLDHPEVLTRLKKACEKHLSSSQTHKLLAAYNLESPLAKKDEEDRLRELVSELRFYLPALAAYQGWRSCSPPKRASRYHFHVPNPIEGPCKGLASHELDVAYLLQNYDEHFDEKSRKIAREMQDQFIRFVNGEGWVEESKLVVFGGEGMVVVEEEKYDSVYRGGRGAVLEEIGVPKLWCLADMWQGVRQEEDEHVGSSGDSKL
jgi:carboxylesterase type B